MLLWADGALHVAECGVERGGADAGRRAESVHRGPNGVAYLGSWLKACLEMQVLYWCIISVI